MLSRCFRGLRRAAAIVWAVFTAWLVVYAMPLSGLLGAAGVWALWPNAGAPSWRRRLAVGAIGIVGLAAVPVVGLPEYAAATNTLHCRALGFFRARAPVDCDAADLADGARIAKEGGALYSTRERLGVHGFNHLLALGGLLVGLPEVAAETVAMSWVPDARPENPTLDERLRQCAGFGAPLAPVAPPRVWEDDLPMRSARVRKQIAAGMTRLGDRAGATRSLGEVHFVSGSNNLDAYGGALLGDSVRVALALEVNDGTLTLTRLASGQVEASWSGTIRYPGYDAAFALPIPTVRGPRVLRVSEAIFCGMQTDGAMNAYVQTYRWRLRADDPRLGAEVAESERGWVEEMARWVVRAGR